MGESPEPPRARRRLHGHQEGRVEEAEWGEDAWTGDDWTDEELVRSRSNWYCLSKTAAEKLAWQMCKDSGVQLCTQWRAPAGAFPAAAGPQLRPVG